MASLFVTTYHIKGLITTATDNIIYIYIFFFFLYFLYLFTFYTPPHDSGGVLWFHAGRPCVCPSVSQSVFRPPVRPFVRVSFPDNDLSNNQWIFTKLDMCINIVEIWLGIANGRIWSIFLRSYLPATR